MLVNINEEPVSSFKVGSIFISLTDENPSSYLGGTWVRFGKGKTLVGIDESDTDFKIVENTGGEKTHKLTSDEMPSHSHTPSSTGKVELLNPGSGGSHVFASLTNLGNPNTAYRTGSTGSNKEHNNMQPYITCYFWKRTA